VDALPAALVRALGARVTTGTTVDSLVAQDGRFAVRTTAGAVSMADAVIVATEAHAASGILAHAAPSAAAEVGAITSASTAVVLLVYPEGTRDALPDGTGFVVPRGKAPMTAATWLSSKWPDEAFGTRAVVRCYVGAAGIDEVVDASDADIVDACARHLSAVVPLPERPSHPGVVRWRAAMPQYELGHLDRVARIRDLLPPGIFVTGQAYDGVGVPDCVRAAGATADAVDAYLAARPIPTDDTRQESTR
jgi:oxygen-dependent protoporphyrinogen oxidase